MGAGNPAALGLVQGIGDDCAVFRPAANQDLVFTTDFALEGRHFTLETHSAADIGHKALARSLSDLAAMGAAPVFCLVSLAVPSERSKNFVMGFYKGLMALAGVHKISLAGGDLAQFDKVLVDVMCCGSVPRGKAMLRSAAKPGDRIYVTGALGESALGFRTQRGKAFLRHRRPNPRVEAGIALRELGVRCAMDLSDGLSLDLARLCRESNVGAALHGEIPVARGATLDDALHGGEDYELLFTAPKRLRVPDAIDIGVITKAQPDMITLAGKPLPSKGFDHFA
jgi:thiamine-monophosphate kinase